ncbi:response regulator (plasmid) [Natrinema zhouii]|uniref:response regulator n=1 Tax=Natrinema zhouii TaxID=1710539 RepID=UPI001CFF5D03|nr:response regulator [Natrinema zhouii]UHQ98727.1 response regulator [Natrinema zhouii]
MTGAKYVGEILLVEDNPGDVRLTKEMFKEVGFYGTYHVATDGVEVLDFLYQRGNYVNVSLPDVIFLDWHFPKKSGKEVLTELKNDENLKQIPVVVLTATEPELNDLKSENPRADAYVLKPFEPEDLIRIVEEFSLEQDIVQS